MKREAHTHACSGSERAKGAVLAGLALLLFARKKCGTKSTATDAEKKVEPWPTKPPRRKFGKWLHCLTKPIRLEDQAKWKKEDEERAIKEAEEAKGVTPASEPSGEKTSLGCVTISCGKPVEKDGPGKEDTKKDGGESSLTGIVVKVLGAVAAGIGVTGAVAVVGGAIFWVRFDAIGLPATQAVSVIPKSELLVQGSQEMIYFLLAGLGAALLMALMDTKGVITRGSLIVLGLLVVGATTFAICTKLSWGWVLLLCLLAIVLALVCIGIAFNTGQRFLPLLISVFLASFVFSASAALLIVHTQKFAQAVAIRFGTSEAEEKGRKEDTGVKGVFVTATSDTIYFGRSGPDSELKSFELTSTDDTGLYEVHRSETTTYAVGPLEPIDADDKTNPIATRAETLLSRLAKDAKSFPAPKEGEPEEVQK